MSINSSGEHGAMIAANFVRNIEDAAPGLPHNTLLAPANTSVSPPARNRPSYFTVARPTYVRLQAKERKSDLSGGRLCSPTLELKVYQADF